ncbi:hypothetical protein [Brevundimonas sp.]|uniref:hypothetical protein n=1 Tax=Brevundimonas sp. TaxID=1871086 RepID=UPI0035AF4CE9
MTPYLTRDDVRRAGDIAGAYLDSLKKTDLAALSADEYLTFCLTLVNEANKAAGDRIVAAWTVPVGAEG